MFSRMEKFLMASLVELDFSKCIVALFHLRSILLLTIEVITHIEQAAD